MAEGFTFGGGPLAETKYLGDWLKWEEEAGYSRAESNIVGAGADAEYPSGTVLETDGSTGMKIFDGTGTVLGILRDPVRVRVGETVPIAIIKRMAVVDVRGLNPASYGSMTLAQIAAAIEAALPTIICTRQQG